MSKIPKILAGLAILTLVVSLVPLAPTAQAEVPTPMRWRVITTPSTTHNVIAPGTEIYQIGVATDKIIYAIGRAAAPRFWKSSDGGYTWLDLTARVQAATGLPATFTQFWAIAVAPDDPNFVAIAGESATGIANQYVVISNDGGHNWGYTGPLPNLWGGLTANARIAPRALDIAKSIPGGLGTIRTVAVGVYDPDDIDKGTDGKWFTSDDNGHGFAAILEVGAVATSWKIPGYTPGPPPTIAGWTHSDVSSVRFSPAFPLDRTLLAITHDAASAWLQAANLGAVPAWNGAAIYTLWPVNLQYPPGTVGAKEGQWRTSDMAIPSDANFAEAAMRRVWLTIDSGGDAAATDDVYRVDNVTVFRLDINAGADLSITSLAYHGTRDTGKLLAGQVGWAAPFTQVKRTMDPQARFPTWLDSAKPPTGGKTIGTTPTGNAFVRWSPDGKIAFAVTSTGVPEKHTANFLVAAEPNDETAFSASTNDGVSFNQRGLIDTDIATGDSKLTDVGVSADGSVVFIANQSTASYDSIFRSTTIPHGTRWERVETRAWAGNGLAKIRPSPDTPDGSVVYYIEATDSNKIRVTTNKGETWGSRASNIASLRDLAVEDKLTIYGVDGTSGFVAKSTDAGWTWSIPVDSMVGAANMISVYKKGNVFVGGTSGRVSYSTDGGASFTLIPLAWGTGNVEVIADKDFDTNKIIYAGSATAGQGIGRWIIGVSTVWSTLISGDNRTITGLATHCGTLYAGDSTNRWADRSLNPTTPIPPGPEWTQMDIATVSGMFSLQPQSIKVSDGVLVWTLNGDDTLVAYLDALSKAGPDLTTPADKATIGIDPVSGRAANVTLTWAFIDLATRYHIQIAKDPEFTQVLLDKTDYSPPDVAKPAAVVGPTGAITLNLEAGKTYYWRVRVWDEVTGDLILSPWSAVRSFMVEAGVPVGAPHLGPLILSPANGATLTYKHDEKAMPAFSWSPEPGTVAKKYKIVIATDPALTKTVDGTPKEVTTPAYQVGTDLAPGTYFWQVQAIDPVGNPSPVANFTVVKLPPPPPPEPPAPPPPTPAWVWTVIAIGAILVIVTLILIVRTGRRA